MSQTHTHIDLKPLLAQVQVWTQEPALLEQFSTDRSGLKADGLPLVLIMASNVAEISATLKFATEHQIPVVTRGAGSGLCGGAVAGSGSIVLDVASLVEILEIDPLNSTATVQAGVINAELNRQVANHGLRFAPDPASAGISSIGGNIATNAGGLRCVKHGVTKDAVLSLKVVLPTGEVLETGSQVAKNVTGYDLTSLFVGSEGTLGVIVEAKVKLIAASKTTGTLAAYFDSTLQATKAVTEILQQGLKPAVVEFLDQRTLGAIDKLNNSNLASKGNAFLLIQTDGTDAEGELQQIAQVVANFTTEVSQTTDNIQALDLLNVRRSALPAVEALGQTFIEDIVVPRSKLADAVERIAQISATRGVEIYTFAHAGDGNLHPVVLAEEQSEELVDATISDIFALAIELGGSVSGEHGIGVLKRPWVEAQIGGLSREIQSKIKSVFDPAGIMNPHKSI